MWGPLEVCKQKMGVQGNIQQDAGVQVRASSLLWNLHCMQDDLQAAPSSSPQPPVVSVGSEEERALKLLV